MTLILYNCDFLILINVLKLRLSTGMHAIKNMSKSKQLLYKNSFVSKLPRNHKILWSIQGSRTCLIFTVDQLVIGYEH